MVHLPREADAFRSFARLSARLRNTAAEVVPANTEKLGEDSRGTFRQFRCNDRLMKPWDRGSLTQEGGEY